MRLARTLPYTQSPARDRTISSRERSTAGITLIETMIALAVVGLISIVGINTIVKVRKSDLRKGTVRVAAMLRSAATMAMRSGTMHRVVFRFGDGTYEIESCKQDAKMSWDKKVSAQRDSEQSETGFDGIDLPPEFLDAVSPEQVARIKSAVTGKQAAEVPCTKATLATGDASGKGAQAKLGQGLRFPQIYVQHLADPQNEGVVAVHFFPLGRAEKAIVEVANEDGDQYSLLVHGLTGRVEFRQGKLDDPEEHMMRDGAGERVPGR